MQRIVALTCFFLTGLTGLVYEVVWIRQAALAFGSTTLALSTILAVFLGGLALGSWWFGRIGQRSDRPLWLYGWLSIAVGLLAAATLPLFGAAEALYGNLYRALSGEGAALLAVRALLISLVVLPATTLMGGGLPLLCRQFVAHRDRIAAEVGFLYGLSTLGAAAGAALTGFWLLPVFGMRAAVLAAAVLNVAVGVAALRLRLPAPARTPASEPTAASTPDRGSNDVLSTATSATIVAALFFFTGLIAVGGEVVWVRFLALLVPNSILTYTITLTVVLIGIALGSLLASRLFDGRLPRKLMFGVIQLLAALTVLALMSLPAVSWHRLGEAAAPFLLLLLPSAILSGALLPIASRLVCVDPALAAGRVGRLVALSGVGGIIGALMIGWLVLPHGGLATAVKLLTGLGVLSGIATLLLLRPEGPRWLPYGLAGAGALLWLLMGRGLGERLPADYLAPDGRLIDYAAGRTATVAVVRAGDFTQLQINRVEQGRDKKDHQIVAAHIPMILHPAPHRVLVVGLGAGQTASRFLYYEIERLDCVDIEPAVRPLVQRHFASDWLDDPRVSFIDTDGREFIAHEHRKYDVISLDLGRPLQPGVEAFYTLEFYRQARARLEPGGLLVQSLPIALFDGADFARVVATFAAVFPTCSFWYNATEPLLIGANAEEFRIEPDRLELLETNERVFDDLAYHQFGGTERWLYERDNFLAAFLSGPAELAKIAADAPLLRDDRPVLSYRTANVSSEEMNELELLGIFRDNLTKVDEILAEPLPTVAMGFIGSDQKHNVLDMGAAAHLRRARALQLRLGNRVNREVFEEISAALRLTPLSVPAVRAMGDALLLAGHPDRAEIPYRRAIELDQFDGLAHLGLGTARFQRQQLAEALPLLERAVLLRPDDPRAHNLLGATLAGLGREPEAVVQFRAAVRLDPGDAAARQNLERGLQILQQRQQLREQDGTP